MIASVLLVLAILLPDLSIRADVYAMPDLAACKRAQKEWITPDEDRPTRWSHCVILPAVGQDASYTVPNELTGPAVIVSKRP